MSAIKEYSDDSDDSEIDDIVNRKTESLSMTTDKTKDSFTSYIGTSFWTGGIITNGLISSIVSLWSKDASETCPTGCQRETWNNLSSQIPTNETSHLLVQSATGSGKTIAFLTPVLAAAITTTIIPSEQVTTKNICFPYAVIVAPTRELALQISHCAETIASNSNFMNEVIVHVVSAIGGVGFKKQVNDILSLKPGAVVVVATPGRLLALCGIQKECTTPSPSISTSKSSAGAFDLPDWLLPPPSALPIPTAPTVEESVEEVEDQEEEQDCLSLSNVKILVLDEADEMIKGGFWKELQSIGKLIPRSSTLLTFSATWSSTNQNPANIVWPDFNDNRSVKVIIDDSCIKANTQDASRVPSCVKQEVEVVQGKGAHRLHRMATLLSQVLTQGSNAIVFVMQKAEAVQVARDLTKLLLKEGILRKKDTCTCIQSLQGDMSSRARNEVLTSFRKGQCKILVATDVAARGIDIESGVSFVLNASLGMSIENYIHRCGRTGRPPLNKGTAHTLVIQGQDDHLIPDLINVLQSSKCHVPEELRELAFRWKQKVSKAEKKHQNPKAAGSGGGDVDEDEQQEILEQRIANREKQKAMQERKMNVERKQSKGKGGGKGKKKKGF